MTLTIAPFQEGDWPEVWDALRPVFRAGDTYPCPPDIDEAAARRYWLAPPRAVYVARDGGGRLAGTYYVRPDQIGLGDHVANCGYVVAETARGEGHAGALCLHSQREARALGYTAMKFNLVVATNSAAVRAWTKSGLKIIGTTPNAFRHSQFGPVDAHIMYMDLTAGG